MAGKAYEVRTLRRVDPHALAVFCDLYEDSGADPSADVGGPWGYLRYGTRQQVARLAERIPCRRLMLPVTLPDRVATAMRSRAKAFRRSRILHLTSKGELCRPITAFPVVILTFLIGKILPDVEASKYVVTLRGKLEEYEPEVTS